MQTPSAAAYGISQATYDKLHKQATDYEGVFLNTLTKEMFSSIKTDEKSFGGGFAEETWRGMQSEQFANAFAQAGGIGLADQLMGDLVRLQEAAQNGISGEPS